MFSAGGSIGDQQSQLDALNAELAALPRPELDKNGAGVDATLAAEKNNRVAALSTALSSRVAWDRVLRQISQILPEDVWLTSLTSQEAPTARPCCRPSRPARASSSRARLTRTAVSRACSHASASCPR